MNELQKIESFRKDLAIAETFEEIKLIGSAADAMAEFAKKEKMSYDKQNEIGEFRVEVSGKKGAWLDEKFPQGAKEGEGFSRHKVTQRNPMPANKRESSESRAIANAPPEVTQKVKDAIKKKGDVITPHKVANEIKKHNRETEIKETIAKIESEPVLPFADKYNVIVIDPPWNYGRKYDPESSRVANPYPEMSQEELLNLEIPADKDCIIWLWTTHAFIWDAKDLLDSWGFEYKAILTWNKEKMGMGSWLRMQCEFCLMGVKGKPFIKSKSERDIITESRREHSRKPEAFYKLIDRFCVGNKLEMFARAKRDNWNIYGAETDKF